MTVSDLSQTTAWAALDDHRSAMHNVGLASLFAENSERFKALSWSAEGLTVDLSKQRLTTDTLKLLLDLAAATDVEGHRAKMFAGHAINATEDRAALHVALRDPTSRIYSAAGANVTVEIKSTQSRMLDFARAVIDGQRTGHTGARFERVVNIGIGGSDLGPRCAVTALANHATSHLVIDFVASADGTALRDILAGAEPEQTLFIVCSKSFSTLETMANAQAARQWLAEALGKDAVASHFVAVSAKLSAAAEFGIPADNVFPMWDWVGGRYSLWSAIGLSIALGSGPDVFERLLAGAYAMDQHFETAALDQNLPVLMALLTVWNRCFLGTSAVAVLPYDHRLRLLPSHLQQLIMESNGKSVRSDGLPLTTDVSPVIFGGSGSESQHSFMQLIHQSSMVVPVEFIVALNANDDPNRDHLIASAFAQSQALMTGVSEAEIAQKTGKNLVSHKVCPGNRPSTTILLESLSPETFGALLALYEHRTFVEGTLWGLNSFDQWGVELGKTLATRLHSDLADLADLTSHQGSSAARLAAAGHDSSTAGLLTAYLARKNETRS